MGVVVGRTCVGRLAVLAGASGKLLRRVEPRWGSNKLAVELGDGG